MCTRVSNAASTENNIDHAALEGEMVTRVSKARGPLSANGQESSGDALLCASAHDVNNTMHRQAHTDRRRQFERDKCLRFIPSTFWNVH
jgi:hypothetical protein